MEERFRFIQDDVFLVARINVKTGKQLLIMEKIDPISGKVEFSESIEIPDKISRKNSDILNPSLEDRFLALKSWTQGIAKAGKTSFQMEPEIAGKLLLFMVRVDTNFIYEYVSGMKRQRVVEGDNFQAIFDEKSNTPIIAYKVTGLVIE